MKPLPSLLLLLLVLCFYINLSDASSRNGAGERRLSFSITNKAQEAVVVHCVAEAENFERTLQPGEKIRWRLWTRNGVLNASTMVCDVDLGSGVVGYFSAFPPDICREVCRWRVVDGGGVEVKSGWRWLSFSLNMTEDAAGKLPPPAEAHNSGNDDDCDDPPPPPAPVTKLSPPPQKPKENNTTPAPAKPAPPPYNPIDHKPGLPPALPPSANRNGGSKLAPPPDKPLDKPATPPAMTPSTKVNQGGKPVAPPDKYGVTPRLPPAMSPLRPITPTPTKAPPKQAGGLENAPSPQKTTIIKVAPAPAQIGLVNGKGGDKLAPSPTTPKPPKKADPPSPAKNDATSPVPPPPKKDNCGDDSDGDVGESLPPLKPIPHSAISPVVSTPKRQPIPGNDGNLAPAPVNINPHIAVPASSVSLAPKGQPKTEKDDELAPTPVKQTQRNQSPMASSPRGQHEAGKEVPIASPPVTQRSQQKKNATSPVPSSAKEPISQVNLTPGPPTKNEDVAIDEPYCGDGVHV